MPLILNEGFAVARGDYIMTCHDHDDYAPTLLEELASALDLNPGAGFSHCGVVIVDPAGNRELEYYIRDYPSLMSGKTFLEKELLPGIASPVSALTMVRASALRGRALEPRFGPCADVELWLRLCITSDVAYVKKPLIRIHQRGPDSQFYERACEMAVYTLAAKREYITYLDNDRRRKVFRNWRREANYTALSELRKCLEGEKRGNNRALIDFLRMNGTRPGLLALAIASLMPGLVALRVLRLATAITKRRRAAALV
jgi:hypothetical protein